MARPRTAPEPKPPDMTACAQPVRMQAPVASPFLLDGDGCAGRGRGVGSGFGHGLQDATAFGERFDTPASAFEALKPPRRPLSGRRGDGAIGSGMTAPEVDAASAPARGQQGTPRPVPGTVGGVPSSRAVMKRKTYVFSAC